MDKLRLGVIVTGSVVREIYPNVKLEAVAVNAPDNFLKEPSIFAPGFYSSLVCEGAHRSLEIGHVSPEGVVTGSQINLREFLDSEIGESSNIYYK